MNDKKDDDKTRRDEGDLRRSGTLGGASAREDEAATKPVERKAREATALEEPENEEEAAQFRELIDETLSAGGEVVASDGEKEIILFDPIPVTADGWVPHSGKKMYADKVLLKLGDVRAAVAINGFGLLDNEGNQVAWCALPEPVNVQPNTTVGIEDSIIF